VRKQDDTGKPVMTGEVAKDREVVAGILSVFLDDHSTGHSSITASDA
jgi:hypothetical protein